MGSVVKKAKKFVRKVIPKEIKPALPYIAAYYGGPLLASKSAFLSPAVSKALIAGTTAAVADEQGDPFRAAALAAAPDLIQSGLGNIGSKLGTASGKYSIGDPAMAKEFVRQKGVVEQLGNLATKASESDLLTSLVSPKGQTLGAQAKALAIPTAIEGAAQLAEIQQDQIDAYNRQLREQGVMNKVKRRQGIFDIYINAGYEPDYVNSVLDKYGYADGGIAYLANGGLEEDAEKMLERFSTGFRNYKGKMKPMKAMFGKKKKKKKESVDVEPNEQDEITVNIEGSEGDDGFLQSLQTAREGIEMAYKPPIGSIQPVPMMKFARGGEVEIEEETDDLGIMDFMKDQGIPYGEMASDINNERVLEQLYEQFLDMGLSPEDAAKAAYDAFNRMSKRPREGIMQMAKSDMEEMYEQYVFEMEEQGLTPMSFSQFVAREKAGMKDGGKVRRRKKGEPMDDDGKKPGPSLFPKVPKGEFFLDKMPKPKRRDGILEAADGGIMEKDMRGGGFIPEGSKERADDVPARLSKNEFVMTADAVRAAGGGSVNKGAKRMYDLMYNLEGRI